MPTISVKRKALMTALDCDYSEEQFEDLCFQFGIEIDEVVVPEVGAGGDDSDVEYKIEVSANRYDLLCFEGLVRALRTYLGKCDAPKYVRKSVPNPESMTIRPTVADVRPHVLTAVVRNVRLDQAAYDGLIDLQEKLHHNLCRKRTLAAIGLHDLDKIKGPFVYEGRRPEDIVFQPLNQTKTFNARDLMDFYSSDPHLKPYLPIIRDSPLYPVIYDSQGVVLSLPPIINGDVSKITLETRNVFVEVTTTLMSRAVIVLDTIVTTLSAYSEDKHVVEETVVEYEDAPGKKILYPKLAYRTEILDLKEACGVIGLPPPPETSLDQIKTWLRRVGFTCEDQAAGDGKLKVVVPPTRHDVIHAYDLYEEIAVAFGYDNVEPTMPNEYVIGESFELNTLSDKIRDQVAQAGFTEAATFTLCSIDDLTGKLRISEDVVNAVKIGNPKTMDFQACRTSLIPGILRTLAANKKMPIPLKIFEVADVVLKDPTADVGTRNKRRMCAVHCGKTPGFEIIHGLLDRVMQVLGVPWRKDESGYCIRPFKHPTFMEGHCAEVVSRGKVIGQLGVLHPEVVLKFELSLPCAALEIDVEPFL